MICPNCSDNKASKSISTIENFRSFKNRKEWWIGNCRQCDTHTKEFIIERNLPEEEIYKIWETNMILCKQVAHG